MEMVELRKGERRKVALNLEIPIELYQKIKAFSESRGVSMRGLFLISISEYLQKFEKEK